ncbi:MAG: hypothetical protein IKQ71_08365 [Lachnospiraceae bacterium]|nr:hypothetical protein [Lachnospiraceae bacterium]
MIGQVQLQMAINHTDSVAHVQQHANQASALASGNAQAAVQKTEQRARETVIPKDTLELHDYNYDAKEEGNNKYYDRRKKGKKGEEDEDQQDEPLQPRVNFDIKL